MAIFADILMVVTGLLAGVKSSAYNQGERYKWGWYTISCIAFLAIFYILIVGGQTGTYFLSFKHTLCLW